MTAMMLTLILFGGCKGEDKSAIIQLPQPKLTGSVSVEAAIAKRRSIRSYSDRTLTLTELSQVLWACQGITDLVRGFRAAPSAGATYPFDIYIVIGKVESVEPGVYKYIVKSHAIVLHKSGDLRSKVMKDCLGQRFIGEASATIVLATDFQPTKKYYGERSYRYVAMEAGHIGENLHLQCAAIGLGTVMVGAYRDRELQQTLGIDKLPFYVMPFGEPK